MTEKISDPILAARQTTSNNHLNKLRASVLGANDGIVSTAGLVLGVSGAFASKESILVAGFAGLVSGAISMAAGEFVSVSSQRDSERAFLTMSRNHIAQAHTSMADELVELYIAKGFSKETAALAAKDIAEKDLVEQEIEKEIGIDSNDITSPWAAAIASALAFTTGSLIPLLAIVFSSDALRLPITATAVLISLILTGTLSARAGQANKTRAALRVVVWGVGAMAIMYAIGHYLGVSLA
jgi:VIT1/CCC1 family predicted Fe2+/Mn2+ transporter